ncbi:Peptidoglycan-binding domain 1 protein [Desulfovibrio sp. X2]|uniref:lytic murein transglycosylase n=1 Tax=Desulfovibrio sp. X2 TaxID=941449 RepID=UPI000358C580|nr:lytic murein transglycosylase [Desulfovibrio sp. X2]EPR41750.1 Peptidoglycan-binding domain 1 protein [Desulfovibrio sp. X2]
MAQPRLHKGMYFSARALGYCSLAFLLFLLAFATFGCAKGKDSDPSGARTAQAGADAQTGARTDAQSAQSADQADAAAAPVTEEDASPPPAEEGAAASSGQAPAQASASPWPDLVRRLSALGHDPERVAALYDRPETVYDPMVMGRKMRTLYEIKYRDWMYQRVQERLIALGWMQGEADGRVGEQTMAAVRAFQLHEGLRVNGWPTWKLLDRLDAATEHAPANFVVPPPPPEKPQAKRPVYTGALTPERINEAAKLYSSHRKLFKAAEKQYGIPPATVLGILNVETRYGRSLGGHNAFVALSSMAATASWQDVAPAFEGRTVTPEQRQWLMGRMADKAQWAFEELAALLSYAESCGREAATIPGSVYGAIGLCQFMPSSAVQLGVDGNGDGKVDLFCLEDAVFSIARYLHASGYRTGKKYASARRKAVWRYNHSEMYVNTVLDSADMVGRKLR